jgi:hypothetical protein
MHTPNIEYSLVASSQQEQHQLQWKIIALFGHVGLSSTRFANTPFSRRGFPQGLAERNICGKLQLVGQ